MTNSNLGKTLDPLTLPSLPLTLKGLLPKSAALYFILDGSEILYIGRTIQLKQRWVSHHRYTQLLAIADDPVIAWLDIVLVDLLSCENELIKRFKPLLNGTQVHRTEEQIRPESNQHLDFTVEGATFNNVSSNTMLQTALLKHLSDQGLIVTAAQLKKAMSTLDVSYENWVNEDLAAIKTYFVKSRHLPRTNPQTKQFAHIFGEFTKAELGLLQQLACEISLVQSPEDLASSTLRFEKRVMELTATKLKEAREREQQTPLSKQILDTFITPVLNDKQDLLKAFFSKYPQCKP